jgi:hypothetical protein
MSEYLDHSGLYEALQISAHKGIIPGRECTRRDRAWPVHRGHLDQRDPRLEGTRVRETGPASHCC